jgi:hypothetical protein
MSILSFVVDADIARSSGETEHPVSSGSRKVLEFISSGGHNLALCPTLRQEWKKHRSIFATKWMATMVARKKVLFIKPSSEILNYIKSEVADSKEKDIALKDAHLLDAAWESGKIVASNDDRARNVFCNISEGKRIISEIIWLHAVRDNEFIGSGVLLGAFVPGKYYLTFADKE